SPPRAVLTPRAARRGHPDAISRSRYGLNRKCNAPDKAPVQPWSTSMLAEIFMLRLEEAARAAKEAAPHRPDHVAGCEGVLTRAAASARLLNARPGHAFGSSR